MRKALFSLTPPAVLAFSLLTAALAGLSGCEPQLDDVAGPAAGALDVRHYVGLGDDYAAGVVNGGLTRERQEYSFPNLLARQLRLASGGEFTQPLLAPGESTGGLLLTGLTDRNQALLGPGLVTFSDSAVLSPGACAETRYRFPVWADANAGALPNNLGIPGLRLQDLATAGLGDDANLRNAANPYNGYLERLLADGTDATSYLTLVQQSQPTFVTVSIGLSDVLPFVRSGGACGTLPTATNLKADVTQLVDELLANTTAKGVLLSVPKLSSLPLTRTLVSDLNRGLGRPDTASMFVQTATGLARTTSTDIVLSPMVGRVGRFETATGDAATAPFGLSRDNPLRDQDVLSNTQFTQVETLIFRTNGINKTLETKAAESGGRLVYLDINSLLGDMINGRYIDGVRYSGDPVTGGLFNFDGYTLTPRGNGLLVNYLISTLNKPGPDGFGTNLPQLDVNSLPATRLP